jgi:glycine/D-amino acid oxidase-like deaminating enzyme
VQRSFVPDVDTNASLWAARAPRIAPFPALRGDTTADVAVIGGGFTGMSTAYHLCRRFPDKRVVLLEAKGLANGASGRNGGLMLNWVHSVETEEAAARRVFEVTRAGIDGIVEIVREHGLDVDYRRDGSLELCTDARGAEAAHARAEALASWGIPVRYLPGAELSARMRAEGVVGAVLDPTAGQINGVALVRGMARVVAAAGGVIHEQTPVVGIDEGREITLTTPEGSVRAQAMVLATNAYTPQLGYFRGGVFALHSHVLATEPLSPEARERLGWTAGAGFSDDRDRISYGSMTSAGEIVFGGGSNAAYAYLYGNRASYPGTPASAERSFAAIRARLADYLPGSAEVGIAHRWTGTLAITMSRVCSMGVMGEHRNVYYALGYSGHGVTLANLAGRVLCDIYSGDDERWRDLPFYMRPLGGVPPEPLRWIGYQLYTRLTGRSPRR